MPGFLSDAQLRTEVAAILKKDEAGQDGLPTWFDPIISAANKKAYATILSHLMERGFLKADIDTWDYGDVFQRCIGIYNTVVDANMLEALDDRQVTRLEACEKELLTVAVIAGGEEIKPNAAIGRGVMNTSQDRFILDTSRDDPRIGQRTRF